MKNSLKNEVPSFSHEVAVVHLVVSRLCLSLVTLKGLVVVFGDGFCRTV